MWKKNRENVMKQVFLQIWWNSDESPLLHDYQTAMNHFTIWDVDKKLNDITEHFIRLMSRKIWNSSISLKRHIVSQKFLYSWFWNRRVKWLSSKMDGQLLSIEIIWALKISCQISPRMMHTLGSEGTPRVNKNITDHDLTTLNSTTSSVSEFFESDHELENNEIMIPTCVEMSSL